MRLKQLMTASAAVLLASTTVHASELRMATAAPEKTPWENGSTT